MNDVHSLLPFVPRLTARHVLPDAEHTLEPRAEWLAAAALFVDIAGFSSLVERLSEEGSHGAERTQEILNRVFDPLVSLIEEVGGEILRFPGDAALALFQGGGPDDPAGPVHRAAAAGIRAIDLLNESRVDSDVVIRLRVAVGAGPVWVASVGGVGGRFELLVRGAAVEQLAGALAVARPGEVVLSGEASALAAAVVQGERRGEALLVKTVAPPSLGHPAEEVVLHREHVQAFVPRSVRARLAAGQSEFLAELRRVSTVFVGIQGLDARAANALERMQSAFVAVQQAVSHYDGSVNQVVDDEKGVVFVLGFGVALHAHEDDGLRATLAALEIRDRLVEQDLDPRIGIASGVTFTGWRGSTQRAEFALIGSAVNLAARLMQQADPILCDPDTRLVARRRVLFESRPPLRVKGPDEPVRVYRPRSAHTDRGPSQPLATGPLLIGRARERRALDRRIAALDSAAEGGVVFVEGEAGVGKSSLIRHLLSATQPTSVRAAVGAGDATEQKTPLLAWKPVVGALLGTFVTPDEASVVDRLRRLLGEESDEAFPLLDPFLPVRLSPTPLSRHISPQARADRIRDLVRRLLVAATARGPLLIVLDDAHWMDSASWELAEAVSDVPGVLLVLSMRPMADRPPPCQRLLGEGGTAVMHLDVIGSEEAVALACRQLDVDTLPEEVARFIHRRAEGHPLFIEQLAHALLESGQLEIAAHECRLVGSPTELDRLRVPETVSGLVRARIDGLGPQQQLTLKVAAVLGRHFDLDGLAAVHPLPDDEQPLGGQLEAMAGLRLLELRSNGVGGWGFRHALIREAAYDLLPHAQRRRLHLEAGRWLEHRFQHDLDRVRAALGHHYAEAGDNRAAIAHLTAAGEHAVELWQNAEVIDFFERVIRLDEALGDSRERDPVVLASRERKIGEAYCNLGNLDRGVPLLLSALERLGLRVPKQRSVLVAGLLVRLLRLIAVPPRMPTTRVEDEGELAYVRETAAAVLALGGAAYPRGALAEGMYMTLRALTVVRRRGSSSALAELYVAVANIAAIAHRWEFARAYTAHGVTIAEREGEMRLLGSLLTAGQLWEVSLANSDALESIDRGAAILASIGEVTRWCTGVLAVAYFEEVRGDFESAVRRCQEALAKAREVDAVLQQLWALAAIADCQLRVGALDEAIRGAQEVLDTSSEAAVPDHIGPFRAAGVLCGAWLRRHGAPPPVQILERGWEEMERGGWQSFALGSAFVGLAEARLACIDAGQGNRAEHDGALQSMAGWLRRTVFLRPAARWTRLWLLAELDWRSGREGRGVRRLRKAIASADAFRLLFEGARLRVALARKLAPQDPERSRLLSAAEDTFAAIGAAWEVGEAQRLQG